MLFGPLFVPDDVRECVSDEAWLEAMLTAERALANVEATAGLIPADAAAAIAARCRAELFDVDRLAEEGRLSGNPVEPLVRALRDEVGGAAGSYVHWGATSQDIMDTAAMLVARRGLDAVLDEVDRACAACAAHAWEHRSTPMVARTLLQQAVPTTFGLKAAGWLLGLLDARRSLLRIRSLGLAAQLGGAAGTLAALGDRGVELLGLFAAELELAEPDLPWHVNRVRIAELGSALAVAAGSAAKIGLDIALLSQAEVGEAAELGGRSSTMPQKRNPIGSTLAVACARNAAACAGVLVASLPQELERAIGGWQAEWPALSGALAYAGGAAAAIADALEGLDVDVERMRRNLDAADGSIVTERLALLLAGRLGRGEAHELLGLASSRALADGRSLGEELADDPEVGLSAEELADALDPLQYLGAAEELVDRALARYGEET